MAPRSPQVNPFPGGLLPWQKREIAEDALRSAWAMIEYTQTVATSGFIESAPEVEVRALLVDLERARLQLRNIYRFVEPPEYKAERGALAEVAALPPKSDDY